MKKYITSLLVLFALKAMAVVPYWTGMCELVPSGAPVGRIYHNSCQYQCFDVLSQYHNTGFGNSDDIVLDYSESDYPAPDDYVLAQILVTYTDANGVFHTAGNLPLWIHKGFEEVHYRIHYLTTSPWVWAEKTYEH